MAFARNNSDRFLREKFFPGPLDDHFRRSSRLTQIWLQRNTLWKASLIGAAIATLLAFAFPQRFITTTSLMPPTSPLEEETAKLAAWIGDSSLTSEFFAFATPGELFLSVLSSRTVQDGVIHKFDLQKAYGVSSLQEARRQLSRRSAISIDRKSHVLSIEVTDRDPVRAMAMTLEYVAQLNAVIVERNNSSSHRERIFLEERLGRVKQELENAEIKLSEFSSGHLIADMPAQVKTTVQSGAALQGQLAAEETQLHGLLQIYGDANVRVRASRARVAELQRQLREFAGTPGQPGAASAQSGISPSVRSLPSLNAQYAALYRNVETQENTFESLTQLYERAKVQEVKDLPVVKILDLPSYPEERVFPQRAMMIATGTLLAFIIGIVWIIARSDWDHLDPHDPGKALATDMLQTLNRRLHPSAATSGQISGTE